MSTLHVDSGELNQLSQRAAVSARSVASEWNNVPELPDGCAGARFHRDVQRLQAGLDKLCAVGQRRYEALGRSAAEVERACAQIGDQEQQFRGYLHSVGGDVL